MQLIYFGAEIKFGKEGRVSTPAYRVFQALGGRVKGRGPSEPGTRVEIPDQRAVVTWDYGGCAICIEKIANRDACIEFVTQQLDAINSAAPIAQIADRRVITNWILPAPKHAFSLLEELYREKMITNREFMQGTYDSGIVLDIAVDDCVLHHQSGAMELKQLCDDYLHFERKDLPKVFVFLYASLIEIKVIQYSREEMQRYLEKAFDHCKAHSEVFSKIWEGYL